MLAWQLFGTSGALRVKAEAGVKNLGAEIKPL